jgi:hypothetical protein
MSLLVQKLILNRLDEAHYERSLAIRIEKGNAAYQTRIHPHGTDEPLSVRLTGAVRVKTQSCKFDGVAEIVVTRLRLIMLVKPRINAPGFLNARLGEVALVSVDRADLRPAQRTTTLTGKIKQVDLAGSAEPFLIQIIHTGSFERLLEVIAPDYALQLGAERAAELREARCLDEARALEAARHREAEQKQVQDGRSSDGTAEAPDRWSASSSRGLLDHLKTWHYKVAAPPDQCVKGFMSAFSGRGGLLLSAKWSVDLTPDGAVARYEGRKGLAGFAAEFSETMQAEQEGAIGSEVRFAIEEHGDGFTICALWLASRTTRLGFTSDARFFKPYMRTVEARLRLVDPSLMVVKE